MVGNDQTPPISASGNRTYSKDGITWSSDNNLDYSFYIYSDATTSIKVLNACTQATILKVNTTTNATIKKINGVANQ